MSFKEFLNESFKSKSKAAIALHDEGSRRNDKSTREFQVLAGKLANYAETGNAAMIADAAKMINYMDDEARTKALDIIMNNDPSMAKSLKRKASMN